MRFYNQVTAGWFLAVSKLRLCKKTYRCNHSCSFARAALPWRSSLVLLVLLVSPPSISSAASFEDALAQCEASADFYNRLNPGSYVYWCKDEGLWYADNNYGIIGLYERELSSNTVWWMTTFLYRPEAGYIRLLSDSGPESSEALNKVEPGKAITIVAKVYDRNNQLVPNVDVRLTLETKHGSGGHAHADDTVKERTGTLSGAQVLTGNTGSGGFQFEYKAPGVSGDVDILATCINGKSCTAQGPKQVWVGVKDLAPLSSVSSAYRLVGDKPTHPSNSYLSGQASRVIASIASAYQILTQFDIPPTPVLHLNDASLERGGIFDINSTWARPHAEHCRGTVIDVRANDATGAIPGDLRNVFERVAREEGADPMWEIPKDGDGNELLSSRHYHVRLLGKEPMTGGLLCPW